MTSGSLGIRLSGSCGSLQQQAQNGNFYLPRRSSKTSLPGYREKERILPLAFRYLSRKKVGMLILAVFAVLAFMTGFFTTNKEDAGFDDRFLNLSYESPLLPRIEHSSYLKTNKVLVCNRSTSWESVLNASVVGDSSRAVTLFTYPCKGFAFPPPPPGDMRRPGPRPCPVCYVPVKQAIALMPGFPEPSPILKHLTYLSEENPLRIEPRGGSDFGGYPSLKQRNDSFDIKESMTVHCGFVKGCRAGYQTGFDIDLADLELLEQFHEVIVASAIFGTAQHELNVKFNSSFSLSLSMQLRNYDVIQQPRNISETARQKVPFFMFIDEETETFMRNSTILGSKKQVGLWKIIVVRNLPYVDSRRNGKVPKLLLHRLFPNTRYSIWIDGKLQLVMDPYQILERFLWRQNATFAISRHYTRFDVFEEAEANKAGGKYDNSSIDYQIEFYKKEGLTPYTTAKLPITSDVPEGCVLIREHIPITNLFSCLWFNEVDRFTSRDQLSFSTVRDRFLAKVDWKINMFLDCERRNFVIQAYHRDLMEQIAHLAVERRRLRPPPPPALPHHDKSPPIPKKAIVRRGKDKKPGSRRRRKVTPRNRENFFL